MKYAEIVKHPEILEYYAKGSQILAKLGYTDHSTVHTKLVAERTANLLNAFGYDEHDRELAKISGFLHDIGNCLNRNRHAEYGAILANEILKDTDLPLKDRIQVVSAIANHDESTGVAADPITAALIIADKSDVRRSRVLERSKSRFDTHDRVNYAVTASELKFDPDKNLIELFLTVDEEICSMYDYFEIFLDRMMMCSRAAKVLNAKFALFVNEQKIL